MSELDVHLAAAYLKRVSLSSSALDELLEEESTRKLRRVSSSNNLEEGQNVGSTGVRFDGSPKGKEHGRRLRGADDMRRVVSADDMRRAAPGAAPDETLPTVSDDSNTSVPASSKRREAVELCGLPSASKSATPSSGRPTNQSLEGANMCTRCKVEPGSASMVNW